MPKVTVRPPVTSIADLQRKIANDQWYAELAKCASENLGGPGDSHIKAIRHLEVEALETSEQSVVEEINFCFDLV